MKINHHSIVFSFPLVKKEKKKKTPKILCFIFICKLLTKFGNCV